MNLCLQQQLGGLNMFNMNNKKTKQIISAVIIIILVIAMVLPMVLSAVYAGV